MTRLISELAGALVMFGAGYELKARIDMAIRITEARFRGDAILTIAHISSIKAKSDPGLHAQFDRVIGTLKKYL